MTGRSPNPMVDLPLPPERILDVVERVIVSHLHGDHFDAVAQELVPKSLPLLCQPGDEPTIREKGFQQVTPVADSLTWNNITITRTDGHHGLGEVETMMGNVSGFVFQASGEPTLYWTGDTVLCDEVRDAITRFQPQVILTHSSGATWPVSSGQRDLIVMDIPQTLEVCRLAPNSIVVTIHLEALDHGTVSRADLRAAADRAGIDSRRLRIPMDGEMIEIE
jgi:L-ascorbate metabolism protein UlaG (beta-lactamase superfamily)